MDYLKVLNTLKNDYGEVKITTFINHCRQLEAAKESNGSLSNAWLSMVTTEKAIELFKQVAKDNIYIDGDSVVLSYQYKKLGVTYNYQAYKNILLNSYPETLIDLQLMYNGDSREFWKENGKVFYKHVLGDPFDKSRKIVGAYCIIKNRRGEFLETLDLSDIEKMKKSSKTQNIWNTWESEMIFKSMMKRATKRHFKDIVQAIDNIDNEGIDPERGGLNDDQISLLQRLDKILPEFINPDIRDAMEGRIKGKQFEQYKENLTKYILEIETKNNIK